MNEDGTPLKDSEGNPVYTTEGRAPEVRADFFGTGFIVGDGKILTNHHVVQPWWQNEELAGAAKQGLEPVIAEMVAYFPNEPNGISVAISQISQEADLALVRGDLSELHRPVLKIDPGREAAVSGDALISVGYATGLDAILARAGDQTVEEIVKISGGDPKLVLAELAKRKLIRPLVTQGHVGDVLPDKIVYDAQTPGRRHWRNFCHRQGLRRIQLRRAYPLCGAAPETLNSTFRQQNFPLTLFKFLCVVWSVACNNVKFRTCLSSA
jgi:hypothetical protein